MLSNAVKKTAEQLDILYDGCCPLCKSYCNSIVSGHNINVSIHDARMQSEIKSAVTAQGIDIDKGIVIKLDGQIYSGADAMLNIAKKAQARGLAGFVNRVFLNSPMKIKIFYPLGKIARRLLLGFLGVDEINNLKPQNTLKSQLGAQWARLHPDIQQRFDREPTLGEVILYEGRMLEMRRSFMGWLFAIFTKIIGNPLSSYQGKNVPMEVALFKEPNKAGVFWKRTYFLPNRHPYIVVSSKQQSKKGEMQECVKGGFGMKLKVYEQDGNLHFKSYQYFWSFFKLQVPIPHWLTPGETHVIHTNLGNGYFTFTISMTHPQLGETFYQHGLFTRKEVYSDFIQKQDTFFE